MRERRGRTVARSVLVRKGRPRPGAAGRRSLTGEETELTEKVHLVEEQMLGLQRVAVGDIDRRPPELHGSSCRRDITVGGAEHAIMGAHEDPLGGRGWPVGEELLDLKADVRE